MPFWRRSPYRAEAKLAVQQIHLGLDWERVVKTGRLSDINSLIDQAARVVAMTPLGHPTYAHVRAGLGRAHLTRYWTTGSLDDLDLHIYWTEDALEVIDDYVPEVPELYAELSLAYIHRHEHRADREDLNKAVDRGEHAVRTTSDHDDALGHRFQQLGHAYWVRAAHTSTPADLDIAISYQEKAVKAGPADHQQLYLWTAHLAISQRNRYDWTGALADLEASIARSEQAVSMAPDEGMSRVIPLSGLSKAYRARFERTGALVDLKACIDRGEQALAAMPEGTRGIDVLLSNLAIAHQLRFRRLGEPADLGTAINLGVRAVDATELDHHNRAGRTANLAEAYLTRHQLTGDAADLDAAVELAGKALEIQDDHIDRATHLSYLGLAYLHRFRRDENPNDLRMSVERGEEAIAATQSESPNRALHLTNLAAAYQACETLPDAATELLIAQADRLTTAPPMWQVVATQEAAALVRGDASARLFRQAIERLPAVAPKALERADQEHELGRHHGLVGDAIAAQLNVGDIEGAVTVAEQGRGILLSAQLDIRTDVTRLAADHPTLAAEFEQLRDALNTPPALETDGAIRLAAADRRRQVAADWDSLLIRIRQTDGFADFLNPTTELAQTAGTVVIVNAAHTRCDAILLRADGRTVVRLPDLTLVDVRANATRLLAATTSTTWAGILARQRVIPEILQWLSDCVTEPVLDAIDEQRVWWVPTGLLSLFPLHAAGSMLDHVVSSYTPTIRALTQRRPEPQARTQLAVSITHTPGHPDLPGVAAEADLLRAQPGAVVLSDEAANVTDVLAALPNATWAHFACHAQYDPAAPSHGGVVLTDGTATVAQISALRLERAQLAYLSACSTAQGSEHISDEAIHLVSAFQLAGYRHVVGTLWPLDDQVAVTAARRFYELVAGDPAFALHQVTHELRAAHPDRPDLWAPLIHSGPS